MNKFSEESRLLIRNYDAYKDIVDAGERLKSEIKAVLPIIAKRLRSQTWWNSKWEMLDPQTTQNSIQICFWEDGEEGHFIWVMVDNLTPDAIFGNKQPAFMTLWIYEGGKRPDLKLAVNRVMEPRCTSLIGEWDKSLKNPSVIVERLPKFSLENIDTLEDSIFTKFSGFIKYYSQFAGDFNKAVEKHLKASK